MNSLQRVLTTLGHQEPDRVPLFLLTTMHGAKELGLSIKSYFSQAETVVEGQLKLRKKYDNDCIYPFFYTPQETEAWGAEVIFAEDGPPNSGHPVFTSPSDIKNATPPDVYESPSLARVLKATEMLKAEVKDDAPIIGVVVSPFSLPVMQMGFDHYFDLMHKNPALFQTLMELNETFCVNWANAQLKAGATAICYFDPVSSPTVIPRDLYLKTGFLVARRTIARINGPTATHLASGRSRAIINDLPQTGTAVAGVSSLEDLAELKSMARGKLTLLGNLNGIAMRRWTADQAEAMVKEAIANAGPGGGFILSDNHGEIPWQVPDEVLMAISRAVKKWGHYPLTWLENNHE